LALPKILAGDPGLPQPQDGASTYRRRAADMQFDWTEPAVLCDRKVRAFNIAKLGVAGTLADGRRLRAFASAVVSSVASTLGPGAWQRDGEALLVGTGRGLLRLERFIWEP
jgi:methionyl-tRNA formyltransferase